jgi:hypothetical protein
MNEDQNSRSSCAHYNNLEVLSKTTTCMFSLPLLPEGCRIVQGVEQRFSLDSNFQKIQIETFFSHLKIFEKNIS